MFEVEAFLENTRKELAAVLIDERVSASATVIKILYTIYIATSRNEGEGRKGGRTKGRKY